mgnify:CR=1 FL=1
MSKVCVSVLVLLSLAGCSSPDPNSDEAICRDFREVGDDFLEDMTAMSRKSAAIIFVENLRILSSRAEGNLATELSKMADSYEKEWDGDYYIGTFDGAKLGAICDAATQ